MNQLIKLIKDQIAGLKEDIAKQDDSQQGQLIKAILNAQLNISQNYLSLAELIKLQQKDHYLLGLEFAKNELHQNIIDTILSGKPVVSFNRILDGINIAQKIYENGINK